MKERISAGMPKRKLVENGELRYSIDTKKKQKKRMNRSRIELRSVTHDRWDARFLRFLRLERESFIFQRLRNYYRSRGGPILRSPLRSRNTGRRIELKRRSSRTRHSRWLFITVRLMHRDALPPTHGRIFHGFAMGYRGSRYGSRTRHYDVQGAH